MFFHFFVHTFIMNVLSVLISSWFMALLIIYLHDVGDIYK